MKSKTLKIIAILGGLIITTLFVGIISIIDNGTPEEFNEMNWPDTKKKAEEVTINYFKNKMKIDIEIKEISFSGEYATREVYIDGHVVGNEQEKISAIVDTSKNYQVKSVKNDRP
ncbi:phosphoglycolate phosphatase [Lysinibacillus fusiformis]|uniref:phosphoglycolate phosphatase n=1 Tax=Lysinibacillus fusiformis TaxID=28031 RepID=UPI0036EA6BAE